MLHTCITERVDNFGSIRTHSSGYIVRLLVLLIYGCTNIFDEYGLIPFTFNDVHFQFRVFFCTNFQTDLPFRAELTYGFAHLC